MLSYSFPAAVISKQQGFSLAEGVRMVGGECIFVHSFKGFF
jgi:hypothetical protein